jgi:hypothetical protein
MRYIELYEGLTVTVLADSATYRLMLRQGFCARVSPLVILRDYRQVHGSAPTVRVADRPATSRRVQRRPRLDVRRQPLPRPASVQE